MISRTCIRWLRHFLLTLLVLIPALVIHAQDTITASTLRPVALYDLPGRNYAILRQLGPQTAVTVEGRDALPLWVLVHAGDVQGWVENHSHLHLTSH